MKRYSVADARKNLADLLTAAEAGETVVVERRGVQFNITAAKPARKQARRSLVVEVDPAVDEGDFTWEVTDGGLSFAPRAGR